MSCERRAWIDRCVIEKAGKGSDFTRSQFRLVEVEDTTLQKLLRHAAIARTKRGRDSAEVTGQRSLFFEFKGDDKEMVVVGGGEGALGVRRIEYSNSLFIMDNAGAVVPDHSSKEAATSHEPCVVVNESYTFELHPTKSKLESLRGLLPHNLSLSPHEVENTSVTTTGGSSSSRHDLSLTFDELVARSMCSESETAAFLTSQSAIMFNIQGVLKPRIPERMWFLQILEAAVIAWNGSKKGDSGEDSFVDSSTIIGDLSQAYPRPLVEAVILAMAVRGSDDSIAFDGTSSLSSASDSQSPQQPLMPCIIEGIFVLAGLVSLLSALDDAEVELANDSPAVTHYIAPLTQSAVQSLQALQATFNTVTLPEGTDPNEFIDRHVHAPSVLFPPVGGRISPPRLSPKEVSIIELPLALFLGHFRRHVREKCGRTWLLTSSATNDAVKAPQSDAPSSPRVVEELSDEEIYEMWLSGTAFIKEAGPASTIGFLPEWRLPARLTARMAVLFAIKPKWRLWELRGYIRPALEQGQTLDWAISKYCRENKLSVGKWPEYSCA